MYVDTTFGTDPGQTCVKKNLLIDFNLNITIYLSDEERGRRSLNAEKLFPSRYTRNFTIPNLIFRRQKDYIKKTKQNKRTSANYL